MCYHKSQTNSIDYLADYYSVSYGERMSDLYSPHFHENGFDFLASPVITTEDKGELLPFNWGLIPWWTKSFQDGVKLRVQTLNCISEEMYDKPAFRDAARDGKRCLIPCTGFFEWRWLDPKGKSKVPYYLTMPGQPLFSIAGLYSRYKDKSTDQEYFTYTVLTTTANALMEKVHNSKKRMPVIIPRQYEQDWLNANLSKDDVLTLCQPIAADSMKGDTISKLITNKKEETDVPKVLEHETYPEIEVMDSGGDITAKENGPVASGRDEDNVIKTVDEKKPGKKKITKSKGPENQTELF
ncbi:MAG: SOS response-associated peptidase [Chryseolinea sp.]